MKSEKARQELDDGSWKVEVGFEDEEFDLPYYAVRVDVAQYAVEIAEQEAEERMRRKAAEAYKKRCFHRDCDWCSISYDLDENGDYDVPQKCDKYCEYCGELDVFIQKLNEE